MNFKIYDVNNTVVFNKSLPYVKLNRYAGTIILNSPAMKIMGIQAGDKMIFLQDQDNPSDWYLGKTTNENGIPVFAYKKTATAICTKRLVVEILASLDQTSGSVRYRLAAEPSIITVTHPPAAPVNMNLFAILTLNSEIIEKKQKPNAVRTGKKGRPGKVHTDGSDIYAAYQKGPQKDALKEM